MIQDVTYGGVLAIPRGATVHGVVSEVKKAGDLKGAPELALKLTSLDLGGQNYPIESDQFMVKGPGKGGQTAEQCCGRLVDWHHDRLRCQPLGLPRRRWSRRSGGHGGLRGHSRTRRLDSLRGPGGLPPR